MTATATNDIETSDESGTNRNETDISLLNDENNGCFEIQLVNHKQKLIEIFKNLSRNPRIIFKSQQIDDPEITFEEKVQIAKNTFNECHLKFLRKFGQYLTREHLLFLQELEIYNKQDYETIYLFKNLLSELEHRQSNIKNRRFTAMKKMMIEQNEYFSETEMMKREPLLYEQLVGQYLTESEKNIRDGYDPKNTLFSQILLDNYDRDERDKLRKQQEIFEAEIYDEDDDVDEESTQKSFTSSKITHTGTESKNEIEMFPKIPPSYRKKWGDFEDDNINAIDRDDRSKPGTSSGNRLMKISKLQKLNKRLDAKQRYITAGEREMLRQEFLSIMRTKFIDGIDKNFDYTSIDDNSDLDDLEQINQDCEDKYFENDEDSMQNEITETNENLIEMEDDLDVYMNNLKKT